VDFEERKLLLLLKKQRKFVVKGRMNWELGRGDKD
jgi:hypothetical protein